MRLSWKRSRTNLLNPVDSRFKDITTGIAKQEFSESDKTIPKIDFLLKAIQQKTLPATRQSKGWLWKWMICSLSKTTSSQSGACRRKQSSKFLDTYWSDHCRHTTFETELKNIDFSASKFQKQLQLTYDKYIAMRDELGRSENHKP